MGNLPRYIVGNWKMHGEPGVAADLARAIAACKAGAEVTVVLCPPAPLMGEVAAVLKGSAVRVGGQDCHEEAQGAHTGDISAKMLKSLGCSHVIVGHSERRQEHGETDALVRAKAHAALAAGLVPIVCVGETLAERESGAAEETVGRQVRESAPEGAQGSHFILAYEPVWAIGTGRTPTVGDIERMHAHIVALTPKIPVLYGGSVKGDNAREILSVKGVSGVLVGGASLKAEEFCKIIMSA